jgi:polyisoprenoid-binding protein YceI
MGTPLASMRARVTECTDHPFSTSRCQTNPSAVATLIAQEIMPAVETGAVLVNVLPDEAFLREHLPGSVNACVYEMAFISRMHELAPVPTTPVIVYGAGSGSLDASAAAAKLARAGYTKVQEFRGGLAEWKAAGFTLQGSGISDPTPDLHGTYVIDTATSVVRWTGRNLFNHHHGTLQLAGGELVIDQGILRSAHVSLDMNTIACEDLDDPDINALLIRHLRDDDFFAVDRFPTAECLLTTAEPVADATEGTPNFVLRGTLTLRGITQPLSFPAVIAAAAAGQLAGQAQFEIDRTQFGSQYGSGRLFSFLGKHVVNDHIHLHVKIHAKRP